MHPPLKPVERLFPFAIRSGIIVPGRDGMARKRNKLLFVLITTDLSPKSRDQIQRDFASLPIVERYTSTDVQVMFNFYGAKVLGFVHCPLSRAILKEMAEFRVVAAPSLRPQGMGAKLQPSASTSGAVHHEVVGRPNFGAARTAPRPKHEYARPEPGAPRAGAAAPPSTWGSTAAGRNVPKLPPSPPSAEPVIPVKSPPEPRLGWRARRKQQKDARIAVKLRGKTPLQVKAP